MAEKRTVELEIKDNSKSLKAQLKEAVMEVQKLSDAYGATSAQAIEAAKRAGELKDRIGDAADLVKSFNPDAKFNALSKSIGGVLDGFQAFEGALGLVGVEGEQVQKTLLKVQSAMALSQGLQGLGEARDSFKQFGGVIKDTFKSLSSESSLIGQSTSALGPIWKAVGLSGKTALSGIRAGIAATGIGLLVVALGTIVAYWDDIKGAVSGVTSEQNKQYESQKLLTNEAKLQYEAFDASVNSLKLQGKSEKEIIQLRKNRLFILLQENKQDIANAEAKTKLEVEGAKRNQSYAKLYMRIQLEMMALTLRAAAAPIDLMMISINKALSLLGLAEVKMKPINSYITDMTTAGAEAFGKLLFDPEAIAAEGKKTVDELKGVYNQNKSAYDGLRLEIIAIDKDANDKAIEGNQEKLDKIKAQEEEYQQYLKDAKLNKLNETLSQDQIEINAVKEKYQKQLDLAKSLKKDTTVIEDAMGIEINAIRKKYADELEDLPMKPLPAYKAASTALVGVTKEATQEELDIIKALEQQKIDLRNQGLDAAAQGFQLLAQLGEKNKAIQKIAVLGESAVGIAKIIVSTQTANAADTAAAALMGPAGVPYKATKLALNKISAGIGIAANIAATAKALQALGGGSAPSGGNTGGGSTGGGGGATGSGVVSPTFNVVGNNGINQLAQLQQQPLQAYVVSGEVTSAQALDRNRMKNATL